MRELPDGWRAVKLGEVCEIQLGKMLSPKSKTGTRSRPYLRNANVQWDRFDLREIVEMDFSEAEERKFALCRGDLLVCEGGEPGRCAVWQDEIQPCPYQKALHRIRPINDSIDPHFVMYHLWLAAISGTFLDSNAKTTIAHLPAVRLAKLPIVLPPLSEQRRIAGVLREQMASVASSRRSAEAQLEAAQFLLAAYLRAVFNSPEAQAWPRKKFEDVAVLQRGHDLPLKNRVPGAYPVMTSSGMVGTHNEYRSKGPGVVTGRSGSVGRVHFVEQDYWPHNTALYVKDFKGSDPRYIYYLLQWVNVKRVSSGTGVPTLDRKEVHKLIVAHPDISDQRRIAAELTERLAGVERLRRSLAEQLEAIEKLPAALLRRAFNGEL